MPCPLYAQQKEPQVCAHSKEGCVGPRGGLYMAAKGKVSDPARNRTPVAHFEA
jgi:hypothetical protein